MLVRRERAVSVADMFAVSNNNFWTKNECTEAFGVCRCSSTGGYVEVVSKSCVVSEHQLMPAVP